MALFGKTSKKEKKADNGRVSVARRSKLAPGAAQDIIRAPWFSEKALLLTEKGVYCFAVPADATKTTIASAIHEIYKVEPRKVRIVNTPGKVKNMRARRGTGTRVERRKAYVYLKQGDTIQFA